MKKEIQFVIVGRRRYRINCIKSYEPFETNKIFGIYIYFSTSREKPDRVYHQFDDEDERDVNLSNLDKACLSKICI